MMTRYCGLPKPEYQIRTSRSFLGRSALASGRSPAVAAAASLVSKMASRAGPVSLAVKVACWARAELGAASNKAAANVNRLMPRGLFLAAEGHILLPHPQRLDNLFNSNSLHCGKWLDKQVSVVRISE